MNRNLYTFYFENNGKENKVEVWAFNYAEAEILAKAEQIHAGRPWQTIKHYKCNNLNSYEPEEEEFGESEYIDEQGYDTRTGEAYEANEKAWGRY